jgi:hypothetical protein
MTFRRSLEDLQISSIRAVDLVYDISTLTRDAKLIKAFSLTIPPVSIMERNHHEFLCRPHHSP